MAFSPDAPPARSRTSRALAFLAVTAVLGLCGAALLGAEVVDRGMLLPFAGDGVIRVRLFDAFELYLSAEARRPTLDLLNGFVLLASSAIALFAALLLVRGGHTRHGRMFLLAGLGTAYLTADELFAVHESIGHNLAFLASLPVVQHPDDLVLALYAVPVVAFLLAFGHLLLAERVGRVLLGAAGLLYAMAAAFDLLGDVRRFEDAVEVGSSACLLAGLVTIASSRIVPRRGVASEAAEAGTARDRDPDARTTGAGQLGPPAGAPR